jgi:hypothetical protein
MPFFELSRNQRLKTSLILWLAPWFGLQDIPSRSFHDAARQRSDTPPSAVLIDEFGSFALRYNFARIGL